MTNTELRRLRRHLNLTQYALAEAVGLRTNTVARYEQGSLPIPPIAATAFTLYAERAATTKPSTSARPPRSIRRRAS